MFIFLPRVFLRVIFLTITTPRTMFAPLSAYRSAVSWGTCHISQSKGHRDQQTLVQQSEHSVWAALSHRRSVLGKIQSCRTWMITPIQFSRADEELIYWRIQECEQIVIHARGLFEFTLNINFFIPGNFFKENPSPWSSLKLTDVVDRFTLLSNHCLQDDSTPTCLLPTW